jgi:hypothetical protein
MATTRLYLQNAAAGYTPATIRGAAWDLSTSAAIYKLGTTKEGASAFTSVSETSNSNTYDVLIVRFVSDGLAADSEVNVEDWCIGYKEDYTDSNFYSRAHIFVTQGDSDNVRGTILADYLSATEIKTNGTAEANTPTGQSAVNAQTGDRIVVELGYRATNTTTNTRPGYVYRGTTDATDASSTSYAWVNPGWIDFTVGPAAASGPALLKTVNGLAVASVKTLRSGLAIASGKTFNGLA